MADEKVKKSQILHVDPANRILTTGNRDNAMLRDERYLQHIPAAHTCFWESQCLKSDSFAFPHVCTHQRLLTCHLPRRCDLPGHHPRLHQSGGQISGEGGRHPGRDSCRGNGVSGSGPRPGGEGRARFFWFWSHSCHRIRVLTSSCRFVPPN